MVKVIFGYFFLYIFESKREIFGFYMFCNFNLMVDVYICVKVDIFLRISYDIFWYFLYVFLDDIFRYLMNYGLRSSILRYYYLFRVIYLYDIYYLVIWFYLYICNE